MRFEVWAPRAGRVDLELNGRTQEMQPGPREWHWIEVDAAHGDRYGYRLDGGPPLPDPASRWQPDGVHGLAAVYDHSRFHWSDGAWQGLPVAAAIIYELHVGTFTPAGTFDAAIERLGHLAQLGVNSVELLPVAEFAGDRGWGYDGVDLFAPHHAYGGPDGLKRLIDACHRHGLAVVLDVVYNHLGPEGNYLGAFGPYFTDRYQTPWGSAVNYDGAGSLPVRELVLENAAMWFHDYHCDGLRLDAVQAIWDFSALHLLEEMASRTRELSKTEGRPLFLVAESDLNDPRIVMPPERGGYGIDAQWSDDFHHSLHALLTGERSGYYGDFGTLEQLAKAFRQAFVYDGAYSEHRQRRYGRRPEGLEPHRFLAFAQTHDQVGNRARGERLSQLVDPDRLRLAAALVLLSPFVPMLFQGEEWGAATPFLFFSSHADPAVARSTREGRSRDFEAFGWQPADIPDPQDPGTFERSKLDWSELDREPHRSLLRWHRDLIEIRKQTSGAEVSVEADPAAGELVLRRGPVEVRCNFERGTVELGSVS